MGSWLTGIAIAVVMVFGIAAFTYGAIVLSRGGGDEIVGDLYLSWSPNGSEIAFTSDRDGNQEIFVVDIDTGEETSLTNSEGPDSHPAWSPAGNKIAFLSTRFGGTDIYVIDPDGSNLTNLTRLSSQYTAPVWSPDGSRIAFTSNRDLRSLTQRTDPDLPLLPERLEPEVYVMNADGTEQTRLTFNRVFDGNVSWSPDGSRIVFQSSDDGNPEIYVMNVDGSGLARLTTNDRADILPAWSPDGSRIAFASNRPLTEFGEAFPNLAYDIYVMNTDGSGQLNLTQSPGISFATRPAWSADSRYLAFDGRFYSPAGELAVGKGINEVYVSQLEGAGAGAAAITRNRTSDADLHMNPVWSPDGGRIAYVSRRTGTYRIRIATQTSEARRPDETNAPDSG